MSPKPMKRLLMGHWTFEESVTVLLQGTLRTRPTHKQEEGLRRAAEGPAKC